MLKLTTYKRGQSPNLKAKLEADGYTYASAMELCSTQKLATLRSEGPVALDVSPLLPLLDPASYLNDTASVTEALMHQLPDDTPFVADENVTAGREYDMRTLFDEIEKSEIEGEPAEKTMRVERGAKLLIDLRRSGFVQGEALTRRLVELGYCVCEVMAPGRAKRKPGRPKSDPADAEVAAQQILAKVNLSKPKDQTGWAEDPGSSW